MAVVVRREGRPDDYLTVNDEDCSTIGDLKAVVRQKLDLKGLCDWVFIVGGRTTGEHDDARALVDGQRHVEVRPRWSAFVGHQAASKL